MPPLSLLAVPDCRNWRAWRGPKCVQCESYTDECAYVRAQCMCAVRIPCTICSAAEEGAYWSLQHISQCNISYSSISLITVLIIPCAICSAAEESGVDVPTCMNAQSCVRACVRAFVHACVRAQARACVRVRVRVGAGWRAGGRVCTSRSRP